MRKGTLDSISACVVSQMFIQMLQLGPLPLSLLSGAVLLTRLGMGL